MKFIFKEKNKQKLSKDELNMLRRMMMSFEQMVNTTLPTVRLHLEEKE